MTRRKRGGASAKGPLRGVSAFLVLAAAVLGGVALKCRPDLWVGEGAPTKGGSGRGAPTASASAAASASGPKKGGAQPPGTTRGPAGSSIHLALGVPVDGTPSDDALMIKPQYALSYNKEKNVANWVSWNLNASYFGDTPRFKGKFLVDDSLPAGVYRVTHDDYVGSGYDRGHMVRSEERTRTVEDNKATFLLTNILPQKHDLNAGPWLRLEDYCQDIAQKENRELFIVAGGVFSKKKPETIGKGVAVPDSFFKIVVVLDRGQGARDVSASTRVIAVVMPNTTGIMGEGWGTYRTTVDSVEKKTGYDFLPAVPDDVQAAVEAQEDSGPTGF